MDNITKQLLQALEDIRQGLTKDGYHNGHRDGEELVDHNLDRYDPRLAKARLAGMLKLNGGNNRHTRRCECCGKFRGNGGNGDHY